MPAKTPDELLYDSEAALRLVDSALLEMGERLDSDAEHASRAAAADVAAAAALIERGRTGIATILSSIRNSRVSIERATLDRIKRTGDELRKVSDATESAAMNILDGIERASTILDDLDACAERDDRIQAQTLRTSLRDELFALMAHMQFQDIASQQLAHASDVIDDVETRLEGVMQLLAGPRHIESDGSAGPAPNESHSLTPADTASAAVARQKIADEIATSRRHGT
ncbi:MAG: hypothetical protein MNPFHGCM_01353 [Gemmatimonadaceae bacterium]|nr:hypothetical protein [Gemmatimonadaceae bacterium]